MNSRLTAALNRNPARQPHSLITNASTGNDTMLASLVAPSNSAVAIPRSLTGNHAAVALEAPTIEGPSATPSSSRARMMGPTPCGHRGEQARNGP